MSTVTRRPTEAVSINGPALKVMMQLLGVAPADLCAAIDCHPSTISKLCSGDRRRCSPVFLTALCSALGIGDRRALLACPYGEEEHERGWSPDTDADTASIPRPEVGEGRPNIIAPVAPGVVPVPRVGRHHQTPPRARASR